MAMILGLDLVIVSIMTCLIEWITHVLVGYLWANGFAGWAYDLWLVSGGRAHGI